MEVETPLAYVRGGGWGDGTAVVDAFPYCAAGGVGAAWDWGDPGVALDVCGRLAVADLGLRTTKRGRTHKC